MKEEKYIPNKEALKIYNFMEDRIIELCEKFRTGNYNEATFLAFKIGAIGDIEQVLKKVMK